MCAYHRPVVGQRVRDRRHELGLSRRQLATLCGVHVSTVQRWERSRFVPVARLTSIATALHTSVAHLIGDEE